MQETCSWASNDYILWLLPIDEERAVVYVCVLIALLDATGEAAARPRHVQHDYTRNERERWKGFARRQS